MDMDMGIWLGIGIGFGPPPRSSASSSALLALLALPLFALNGQGVRRQPPHLLWRIAGVGAFALFVVINLIVDLLYFVVDPRLRADRAAL